jgi:L-fuconolactonase
MSNPLEHYPIREQWLSLQVEEPLGPDLPIIDTHQHVFDRPGWRYLFDDMLADLRCGHDIRATVYVQANAMLRQSGPPELRAVGETEFANGLAAMFASGQYGRTRACAAIVGFADLCAGDAVRPVLEAHIGAAGARFRGIRQGTAWDPHPELLNPQHSGSEDMLTTNGFRHGFRQLTELGLTYDAWVFFHQLPRVAELARAFPETPIVVNHCGGIIGVGPYAGRRNEVFERWCAGLHDLARCPNVHMKIGGLGMKIYGFGLGCGDRDRPASSEVLAAAWAPWVHECIETLGSERCMFESNFPVDKGTFSYLVGWNAMKRLATGASADEKDDLFWRTASRFYRVPIEGSLA